MPRTYLDFDLLIEPAAQAYRARVLDSPTGQAATDFALPFSALEMENFLLRLTRSLGEARRRVRRLESQDRELVKSFGGQLFEAMFSGTVLGALQSSLNEAFRKDAGLRIRLRLTDAPKLADVPWEFLFNPAANKFLGLSPDTPLVRYLDLPMPTRTITVSPPLKILVMISSPADFPQLDVSAEWDRLNTAVGELVKKGLVTVTRLPMASLAGLQRPLRLDQYHILHFIGHGGFDEQAQDGALALEDAQGRARLVSGQDLGVMLSDHHSLRLIVLNACEGARSSSSDPFAGVAQSLVQQGIPAVIAMQFEITDEAAITFASELYGAIADGYPIDAALAESRRAIFASGNDVEWATPVLYMRTANGQLFRVTQRRVETDAEREAKEQAERLAKERADREEAERPAKERADREEAERQAVERAEREEAERLAKERAERQEAERLAKERAERQEAERQAKERADREEAERPAVERTRKEPVRFVTIGIVLLTLGLVLPVGGRIMLGWTLYIFGPTSIAELIAVPIAALLLLIAERRYLLPHESVAGAWMGFGLQSLLGNSSLIGYALVYGDRNNTTYAPFPAVVLALGSGAILTGGLIAFTRYRAKRTASGPNDAHGSSSGSAALLALLGGTTLVIATLVPLFTFEGNSYALIGHGGGPPVSQFLDALEPLGVAAMVLLVALALARHTIDLSLGSGLLSAFGVETALLSLGLLGLPASALLRTYYGGAPSVGLAGFVGVLAAGLIFVAGVRAHSARSLTHPEIHPPKSTR